MEIYQFVNAARSIMYFVLGGLMMYYAEIFSYPPVVFTIGAISVLYGFYRVYRILKQAKSQDKGL